MYKLPFIFLLALFCCKNVYAQTESYVDSSVTVTSPADDYVRENNDSEPDTTLTLHRFVLSNDSITAWKNAKSYKWIKNLDSLLKDAQDKANKKPADSVKVHDFSFWDGIIASGILQIIFWSVAAMVVLFIVYRLFLSKGIFSRSAKKASKVITDDEEDADHIAGKDFTYLLNKAYTAGDYRTATRWLFLMTLQKLEERELIKFAADKTNSVYVRELPPAKRDEFASLALYYEYIWYGKAPLQKETFDAIKIKYNDFLNRI